MQVFTYGVKAADGLLGTRVCLLLCLVFVCSICRDADASTATNELPIRHPSSSLTQAQLNSAVTIEFDFRHIDPKNRAALIAAYREVRLRLLRYLNRRKSTTASPTFSTITTLKATRPTVSVAAATTIATTPSTLPTSTTMPTTTPSATTATSTSLTTSPTTTTATTSPTTTSTTTSPTTTSTTTSPTTTAATTTQTSTIITSPTTQSTTVAALATQTSTIVVEIKTDAATISPTTKLTPPPERKRRRRRNDEEEDIFIEDDFLFVDNEPEIDEHGNVRITIFINKTGFGDRNFSQFEFDGLDPENADLGVVLHEAAIALNKSGELEEAANSTVIAIYKGLPAATQKVNLKTATWADLYLVWLPILLAILLLLIILIFTFCRKATNKKVEDEDRKQMIPKPVSKPHIPPTILDDNCGWIVPYGQFSNEEE